MIELRAAKIEDALDLAPRLRPFDLEEIMRDPWSNPETSLLEGVRKSDESWAGLWEGRVEFLGGVRLDEQRPGAAIIWLLGSPELARHRKEFLLVTRGLVEGYREKYRLLHNLVGQNSQESKRYLRWLGFVIEPEIIVLGTNRVPYQYFWQGGHQRV